MQHRDTDTCHPGLSGEHPPAGDPGPPSGPLFRVPPARSDGLGQILPLRRVRCECAVCGVHTIASGCVSIGGCCPNCGSYDLRPVDGPGSDR